jgi:hypothetical protein
MVRGDAKVEFTEDKVKKIDKSGEGTQKDERENGGSK